MSRGTRWSIYLLASLGLAAASADAQADHPEVPDAIEIVVDGEPGSLDAEGMIDALRLELGMDGVDAIHRALDARPDDVAVVHLAIRESPLRLDVRLVHQARQSAIVRELDLSDVPERSWSRTVALCVAELVRGSWAALAGPPAAFDRAEVATRPSTVAPPPAARASIASRTQAAAGGGTEPGPASLEPPPSVDAAEHGGAPTLAGAFVARGFPTADLALLGGQIRVAIPLAPAPSIRLAASLGFSRGTIDHRLGHVEMLALVGAVGVDLALGGRDWSFAVGPRVALGWAYSNGEPSSAGVTGGEGDAAFLLLSGASEVALRLIGPLRFALGVEVGVAVLGVTALADEERAFGIEALSLAAWAGPEVELE
ncbi:MAG: hypothetical protein AB7S26_19900 [Sandaracinaceae bacterium]